MASRSASPSAWLRLPGAERPRATLLIAQPGSSLSNSFGIGSFPLTIGSYSGSTHMLPGGSYTVAAHYGGNGTFAASDSSPGIPLKVGQESSVTHVEVVACDATSGACTEGVTSTNGGTSDILVRAQVTNSSRPAVRFLHHERARLWLPHRNRDPGGKRAGAQRLRLHR